MEKNSETNSPEQVGRYRILKELGRGGMTVVFEATDKATGETVALKLLEGGAAAEPDSLGQFIDEAKILTQIRHPNVVRLLDSGQTGCGQPYLAFELVKGRTLKEILDAREKPDWSNAVNWMMQAAEGLDEAWKTHIIHRDIKPGNVMIDEAGDLRLLDFGLARAIYDNPDAMDRSILQGTPRYISPEMGLGLSLDFRADMYSLGSTFYHYVTGQSPFEAATLRELVMKHALAALPPPHKVNPEIPADLCDILTRLLQKDPAGRYQTYHDLIGDLREARLALRSEKISIPPAIVFRAEPTTGARDPAAPTKHTALISLALLLLACAVALGFWGNAARRRPPPPALVNPITRVKILSRGERPETFTDKERIENEDRMQRAMSIILQFDLKEGRMPENLSELEKMKLAAKELLDDLWGRRMVYNRAAGTLLSLGADGVEGSPDDFMVDRNMKPVDPPQSRPQKTD